jgi:4-hydroxy-2-oxoheptanedioate aldolase
MPCASSLKRVVDTANGWGTLGIGREHYLKVKALGAQLICPGGDVRVMLNGVRELAKTFQDPE